MWWGVSIPHLLASPSELLQGGGLPFSADRSLEDDGGQWTHRERAPNIVSPLLSYTLNS